MSLSTLSEYKSRYQIGYFSKGVLADNLCTYSFERSLNDDKIFCFHKKINYHVYI